LVAVTKRPGGAENITGGKMACTEVLMKKVGLGPFADSRCA
jgi:hypothetical protein